MADEFRETKHSPEAEPIIQDPEESGLPGPDREANLLGQKTDRDLLDSTNLFPRIERNMRAVQK